jgi:hypothetical protein
MAKSIRLKTDTQQRVTEAVTNHYAETGVRISDAQMVAALVDEALNARANVAARQEQARKAVRK